MRPLYFLMCICVYVHYKKIQQKYFAFLTADSDCSETRRINFCGSWDRQDTMWWCTSATKSPLFSLIAAFLPYSQLQQTDVNLMKRRAKHTSKANSTMYKPIARSIWLHRSRVRVYAPLLHTPHHLLKLHHFLARHLMLTSDESDPSKINATLG